MRATWIFIFLVAALTLNKAGAVSPSRLIGDDSGARIQFATATVNGIPVFDGNELSGVEKFEKFKGRAGTIVNFTPSNLEVSLATCPLTITGYSDYLDLFTKPGLKKKIKELRREINEADPADLPDLQARLDYLKSYRQSLP